MPSTVDKDLVRRRFRRCLTTYDAHATVQRRMAEQLVDLILTDCGKTFPRTLEIGSGTGVLTRQLLKKLDLDTLWTNDLVAECHEQVEGLAGEFQPVKVYFMEGDIENAAGIPDRLDLIVANAVFQWVQDLPHLLKRLVSRLTPGGVLAFSTFGPDNLAEIRHVAGESLTYHSSSSIGAMLPTSTHVLSIDETRTTLQFASPREVLEHLQLTGSNGVSRRSWTRKSLADFESLYRSSHSLNDGVGLTYHPILVVARTTTRN